MALHDAIAVLRAYSLIEGTDQFVSIHRLVQLVVRDRLNASDSRQFHDLADRLEHGVFDPQYPDVQVARKLWGTAIWDDLTGNAKTRRNFLILAGATVTIGGIGYALYKQPEDRAHNDLESGPPEDDESPPPKGVPSAEAFSLTWLPEVLKIAGLKVEERSGWRNRGRGDVGSIKGVMCHQTSGPRPNAGNMPSLGVITDGRADMPGPFAQLALGRDGTFFVVAAGRADHAGRGVWQGISTGNSSFIGIMAENSGLSDDPWPRAQLVAYMQGVAAILKKIDAKAIMCCGHKEYALPRGRKDDPSFDMSDFRAQVALIMAGKAPVPM
jgi:N-acetylmuramoyl-L-alanine amidase-like protein